MNLEALFDKAQELPNIPEVVQELIQSFEDDNFDVDDVAKKIGMDQVLSAKVLRMANSAKFGGNRTVSSINEAVVRLGFNALRTLVLASGFTATFKAPEGFDLDQFWRDSFAVAELSKWIAQYTPQDAETAFTCGMLSNIGGLIVHILLPEKAQEIDRVVAKGGDRSALEQDAWGFSCPDVGAKLASQWKFPEIIVDGIQQQREPSSDSPLAGIIALAAYLLRAEREGRSVEEVIASFPNDLGAAAGVDLARLQDNLEASRSLESGIDALLG